MPTAPHDKTQLVFNPGQVICCGARSCIDCQVLILAVQLRAGPRQGSPMWTQLVTHGFTHVAVGRDDH